jgi:hypothetical protein
LSQRRRLSPGGNQDLILWLEWRVKRPHDRIVFDTKVLEADVQKAW